MKEKTKEILIIGFIILIIGALVIVYEKGIKEPKRFCKDRGMNFEDNMGMGRCYKITNATLEVIPLGRINGEIYIR